ncbi:FxLYD domain-containing protein [Streptomyces narbonensis]|uniref:FxLYD domain-containing protein n=1 Tax=Streptomyces narbonensis TaxID=67333 RepID=UPI0033F281CA
MSNQEPPPGWGRPQPGAEGGPPPRKGNAGKIIGFSCLGAIVLVVLLIVAVALVGRGEGGDPERESPTSPVTQSTARETSASERPQEESGPRGDVKITACEVDSATKWPSAELLVTNRSSKASNYIVQVEFVDASHRRLSEAYATTNGLAPGQESRLTAQGLDQITAEITCRITDVSRFAS